MRKLGFTGTSDAVTLAQKVGVAAFLESGQWSEFHHGVCIVADAMAHGLAVDRGIPVVGHPPLNTMKMAILNGFLRLEPPQEYMVRNQDIVDAVDVMLATPKEFEEQLRSGTWSTIRKARRAGKPVWIILPDGRVVR